MVPSQRPALLVLISSLLAVALSWPSSAYARSADAVVLVNSSSPDFGEFARYVQPYLDLFGVPYIVHDIGADPLTVDTVSRALIIIGHDGLDEAGAFLDSDSQGLISEAVFGGAGLVNFDTRLADSDLVPRYQYVQDALGLSYSEERLATSIEIGLSEGAVLGLNCWEDGGQDPVLPTFSSPALLNDHDGQWDEFDFSLRPFPTVLAGHDEWENHALQPMHFFAAGIPNGRYEVWANLYTGSHTRHYYGFTEAEVAASARWVDNVKGAGGPDQHDEYLLGTVEITDGGFDLWVGDGDPLAGSTYYYGWAWVTLVSEEVDPSAPHYISARHQPGEILNLEAPLPVVGVTPPSDADIVARAGGWPFLVAREYGQGRAVQWGSYRFTESGILGYLYGMDDLVWRSLVWAADKPFALRGMPPLLPFRVDDCSGPFWWAEDAAALGLKPWIGFFLSNLDAGEIEDLRGLVADRDATASVHSFTFDHRFYYDPPSGDYPDALVAAHLTQATEWHDDNGIPVSEFVLGHFYELGTNVFDGLRDWGVEFVGTLMAPGTNYGSPRIEMGPYGEYAAELGGTAPLYYADFLTVPGHPEHNGRFFNVVTEIRDVTGYEWYPDNDVDGSIERGATQIRRAFDSMVLATLFSHEQLIQGIDRGNWSLILDGVLDEVAEYDPILVTMDEAARYVRATVTSELSASEFEPTTNVLTASFDGDADMATYLHLFTEEAGQISEQRILLPAFLGGVEVSISTDLGGFGFSPFAGQLVGVPFSVTITALDGDGIPTTGYSETAILDDSTDTVTPTLVGPFVDGVWTGDVTILQPGAGVVLTVRDGSSTGVSDDFEVVQPECSDGVDNDGDGYIDFQDDPGCQSAASDSEEVACQDGSDNDRDTLIDFDGGQSIYGQCSGGTCPPGVSDPDGDGIADADPHCASAHRTREAPYASSCGLGSEVALAMASLFWLEARRRKSRDRRTG